MHDLSNIIRQYATCIVSISKFIFLIAKCHFTNLTAPLCRHDFWLHFRAYTTYQIMSYNLIPQHLVFLCVF